MRKKILVLLHKIFHPILSNSWGDESQKNKKCCVLLSYKQFTRTLPRKRASKQHIRRFGLFLFHYTLGFGVQTLFKSSYIWRTPQKILILFAGSAINLLETLISIQSWISRRKYSVLISRVNNRKTIFKDLKLFYNK